MVMRPIFVVDPRKCIGCMACVAACSIENGVPFTLAESDPVGWPLTQGLRTWVLWIERDWPEPSRKFMPYLCQHCQDAPCERVCPTGATFKTKEGVVLVDKDKCIGCKYCIIACPYGARYAVEGGAFRKALEKGHLGEARERLARVNVDAAIMRSPTKNPWAAAERAVDKCTLCYHRKPKDGERWVPACVEVCPTKARAFGDMDDPNDPVAKLVNEGRVRHLRPDLGTGGLVMYVYP